MFECVPCVPSVYLRGTQPKAAWLLGWRESVYLVYLFFTFPLQHRLFTSITPEPRKRYTRYTNAGNPRHHWAGGVYLVGTRQVHRGAQAGDGQEPRLLTYCRGSAVALSALLWRKTGVTRDNTDITAIIAAIKHGNYLV